MSNHLPSAITLTVDDFGEYLNEKGNRIPIKLFTWQNQNHLEIQIINYGASIISIKYPDKFGIIDDILLGFDNLRGYIKNKKFYFGSTIGRYANIIKNSRFTLSKKEYCLKPNLGAHHFNGGYKGFHQIVWHYEIDKNAVILTHFSPHNQDGYPGHLIVKATFELQEDNEFRIEYRVVTTKLTIINITNHCYFNLAGHFAGCTETKRHKIMMKCDRFTVTNNEGIPTGQIKNVKNTDFDFKFPASLAPVFKNHDGINKNFCVINSHRTKAILVARLSHSVSGRFLDIYSNQPGIQFSTANDFPEKPEWEDSNLKRANCQYLNIGVVTFDILDEIYNEIKRVANINKQDDYTSLIELVQELEYKSKYIYRILSCNKSGVPFYKLIKRAAITLDNMTTISLTPLQKKFVRRIAYAMKDIKEDDELYKLKDNLEELLFNNTQVDDLEEVRAAYDKNLPGNIIYGKGKNKYWKHGAICIQTQNYPDACNQLKFPDCLLTPGRDYIHIIKYKFRVTSDESGLAGYL